MPDLVNVDLKVSGRIDGDVGQHISNLVKQLRERSFPKLDAMFGGEAWCHSVRPLVVTDPNDPGVRLVLEVDTTRCDIQKVYKTLEADWKAIQPSRGWFRRRS